MTFKRQMEKAVKEYLKSLGYKYYPKMYLFVKNVSDDIIHTINFADENHYQPQYYYLRPFVTVASKSLNEILYEVTDGMEIADLRPYFVGPVYQNSLEGVDVLHSEFIGARSMEENMEEFDKMYKEYIQRIYDKYPDVKSIYTGAAHNEYYNLINTPCVWYYAPLSYFFLGEFDQAFAFIDDRIECAKYLEDRALKNRGSVSEETLNVRRSYLVYRKNLQKWIEERKTFKVGDEYLPHYVG